MPPFDMQAKNAAPTLQTATAHFPPHPGGAIYDNAAKMYAPSLPPSRGGYIDFDRVSMAPSTLQQSTINDYMQRLFKTADTLVEVKNQFDYIGDQLNGPTPSTQPGVDSNRVGSTDLITRLIELSHSLENTNALLHAAASRIQSSLG